MYMTNCLMKQLPSLATLSLFLSISIASAQDGEVVSKTVFKDMGSDELAQLGIGIPDGYREKMDGIQMAELVYLSDGLKVKAYLAEPKQKGSYPCIIYNRSGSRQLGAHTRQFAQRILGEMASWGYVVVESQLRGTDGGEGSEEFGGKDINDIKNLVPLLASLPNADTSRIGMYGRSRGGMMTFICLKEMANIKAAVVLGAPTDLFEVIEMRPGFDELFAEMIPNYSKNRKTALADRSMAYWPEKMAKSMPILWMQGAKDDRIPTASVLKAVKKLHEAGHPFRFVYFENAGHAINEFREETELYTRNWFDRHLKNQPDRHANKTTK